MDSRDPAGADDSATDERPEPDPGPPPGLAKYRQRRDEVLRRLGTAAELTDLDPASSPEDPGPT